MKLRAIILTAAILAAVSCSQSAKIIKTPVPARPAGQETMLQFAAEPIADVGIGVVGLGDRGSGAVHRLSFVPGSHVAAICDSPRADEGHDIGKICSDMLMTYLEKQKTVDYKGVKRIKK